MLSTAIIVFRETLENGFGGEHHHGCQLRRRRARRLGRFRRFSSLCPWGRDVRRRYHGGRRADRAGDPRRLDPDVGSADTRLAHRVGVAARSGDRARNGSCR